MDFKYDKKLVNKLIDDAMKSWTKIHYIDAPKDGPIFITREGKMIWGDTTHGAIVDKLGINLFYASKIEGLTYLTMWDFFEEELGWIRCNSGTTSYEGTTYIAIDRNAKPTEEQYKTLEDIIYYYFTKKKYIEVWIVSNGSDNIDERQNYYREYDKPEDIIKSIKKYFQTGLLEGFILHEIYPNKGESKKDFIKRFMSVTAKEYPDTKQRFAVANSYWDRRNKKRVNEFLTEHLEKATPYMLRNDGVVFKCKGWHPYISGIYNKEDDLDSLINERLWELKWFYDNTLSQDTKDYIKILVKSCCKEKLNLEKDDKELFSMFNITDDIYTCFGKEELYTILDYINNNVNQEFCKVRTSDVKLGGNSNDIYFRISSIGFNWFDIIWDFVANNSDFITTITISRDGKVKDFSLGNCYKIKGKEINHLPLDEFLSLSGNPIIEEYKGSKVLFNDAFNKFKQGQLLAEAYPTLHPRYACGMYQQQTKEELEYDLNNILQPSQNKAHVSKLVEELENKDEIIKALKDNFEVHNLVPRCFILPDGTCLTTIKDGTIYGAHYETDKWLIDKGFISENNYHYFTIKELSCITCNGFGEFYCILPLTRPTNAQLDTLTKWLDKYYYNNPYNQRFKVVIPKTKDIEVGTVEQARYNPKETDVDTIIKNIKRYYTSGILAEDFSHLKGDYTYEQIDKELKDFHEWKDTPNKMSGAQLIDKNGKFLHTDKYHGDILKTLIGYEIIKLGDNYLDEYNYINTDLFSKLGYIRCNNDEDYSYIQLPEKLTGEQIKALETWLDTFYMSKTELFDIECPMKKQFIRYYLDDDFKNWGKDYSDIHGGTIDDLMKMINRFNQGAPLREKKLIESLLLERTRNDLINQSKKGANYKTDQSKGKNRWERKKYSKVANLVREFNKIDMNTFFKKDILNITIPVKGETDDYQVKIKFNGVLKEIQRNVKANDDKLEYKTIITALTRTFNNENVYVWCSCPDHKYRFDYWCTIQDYNSGKPQLEPTDETNPEDSLGAACKHINLVLSNLFWLMKVASVLNNYIHFAESNMQRQFAEIIFPKIYGMSYPKAYQLGLFDRNYLKHSKGLIDYINDRGKDRGKFKSTKPKEDEEVVVQQDAKNPTFKNSQPTNFSNTDIEVDNNSNQPKFSVPKGQLSIFDFGVEDVPEKEN